MAISGLIAATPTTAPGYLIYSPGDHLPELAMVFGPPFLVAGVVLWSGVTLSGYCRRLLKWPWVWNGSVHNYDGHRALLPGLLLGTGAFLLTLGAAAACADVAWLHPVAWLLTGVAFAVGALAAAYLLVYPWVNLPKWLRPKAHRCQVHRAREQNRATFISRYADPDVIEAFKPTGTLPPRRRPDPVEDWLRAQGPLGEAAIDELYRLRERDEELRRQPDVNKF